MTLFLDDGDVRLYHGDAVEQLRLLPDGCVDMVATSPPFYGLRDYGTDAQIGLEETPDQWVANLVAVFRECRRVLADHGTLWVEIGDSYNSRLDGSFGNWDSSQTGKETSKRKIGRNSWTGTWSGAKPKDLLGQPWLLAFALRADGWYLRSEIIWARPNPMPESVTDRPTKSHSTVFLLSKRPRYFYDADAIREGFNADAHAKAARAIARDDYVNPSNGSMAKPRDAFTQHRDYNPAGANARSVWTIPTEPTPFAHFATWPQKLVARMIQAGTSERGRCPECGKPWVRDVEKTKRYVVSEGGSHQDGTYRVRYADEEHHVGFGGHRSEAGDGVRDYSKTRWHTTTSTVGWSPSCAHQHQPSPCTVLDPFAGSGTTLLVARNHGRHAIGIELNPDYCKLATQRLQQLSLLT